MNILWTYLETFFPSKYFPSPVIDISARGRKITTKDIHRRMFFAMTRSMNILAKYFETFCQNIFLAPEIDILARGTKITTKDIHRRMFLREDAVYEYSSKILRNFFCQNIFLARRSTFQRGERRLRRRIFTLECFHKVEGRSINILPVYLEIFSENHLTKNEYIHYIYTKKKKKSPPPGLPWKYFLPGRWTGNKTFF